ncbi:MAG TPA: hypothetical protein DIU37_05600 [Opitutae bacterium]|nr:hypothetical protein [Opitutae bacterium]|tara:strand:- start:2087 stop:2902 length:816 start_codon:yes stop_codon:yes gene_type:complete
MQTIGERLEEARKRQGLSIREAAEATKIRSDFLINLENNQFEFDLPEVYKRGFLRLYAKYLKMDAEKLVRDYQASRLGSGRNAKRESRETLGRMDLQETSFVAERSVQSMSSRAASNESSSTQDVNTADDFVPNNSFFSRIMEYPYAKVVGAIVAAIVLIALTSLFIGKVFLSESTPDFSQVAKNEKQSVEPVVEETIRLLATRGDVHVVVRQEQDKKKLYSGTLKRGEDIALRKRGQIKIHFSEGENLVLEKQGKQYGMNADGIAVRVFD